MEVNSSNAFKKGTTTIKIPVVLGMLLLPLSDGDNGRLINLFSSHRAPHSTRVSDPKKRTSAHTQHDRCRVLR